MPASPSPHPTHEALVTDAPLPPLSAEFVWASGERSDGWQTALFRREFSVSEPAPSRRIVVSADSRYILWLNGQRLGRGPLKGTLSHYHAEIYELAPLLQPGRNVLAAEVRWWGQHSPMSEVHGNRPGFLVQDCGGDELNTPGMWRVHLDRSVSPQFDTPFPGAPTFLGPLDRIDARQRPAGWTDREFDATAWSAVESIPELTHTRGWGLSPSHQLYPRNLPMLREETREFAQILLDRNTASLPWTVAANTTGELWLDAGPMATSYPVFEFNDGKDRLVEVVYAEALGSWQDDKDGRRWRKSARRDDLAGGEPHGYRDVLILPGGTFTFEPFHWRIFRYIKLVVQAGPVPLTLKAARHRFTTFPQSFHARFASADTDTAALWKTSVTTLQLCAHETYEDCPYFEQLNYIADARLQALCSQYLANDTRLGRHSLLTFRDSLDARGLMAGRAPARERQVIPTFSLHWILMLGDHWRWRGSSDQDFVRGCLPAVDAVLCYFRQRLTPENFVGRIDDWAWIDWVPGWPRGVAPFAAAGDPSTFLSALFAMALETAVMLHNEAGEPSESQRWAKLRNDVQAAIRTAWSESAGGFHEGPGREADPHTQHTQAMAILSGAPTSAQLARVGDRLAGDSHLVPMSLMHRFYLASALSRVGRLDRLFPGILAPWRTMLANGLTTWQEMADPSRSDCHAWSSWPVVTFLQDVLGVRPGSPGWKTITIAPAFNATSRAEGEINTPVGPIRVAWSANFPDEIWKLVVDSPTNIPVTVSLPGREPQHFPHGGHIALSHQRG